MQNTARTRDELIVELNRQKEATKTVIQSSQSVSQKLGELSSGLQQSKQVVERNTLLEQEINTTKQRLDLLEENFRKSQTEAHSPAVLRQDGEKSEW